jgi:drug/metabolite transporter (DMT)-like permease
MIWGSTWLVIKSQLTGVPPAWSIVYRFVIGTLVMFGYAAASGSTLRIDREGHMLAAAFGIPQFCFNFNLVYLAERHVTSGLLAVVFALLLVPNSLLSLVFLKHRVSRRFLAGSIVAIAGVALLFVQELSASRLGASQVLSGIGLTLLAVLCSSVANVFQAAERVRSRSLPGLIAWGMAYGLAADVVIAWLAYGPPRFETGLLYVGGLLYLGLIASAFAFSLYFALIRRIGPGRAAYTSLLIPVIAMALSTVVEDYRWSPVALAGAALALAGLYIALNARSPDTAPAGDVIPTD